MCMSTCARACVCRFSVSNALFACIDDCCVTHRSETTSSEAFVCTSKLKLKVECWEERKTKIKINNNLRRRKIDITFSLSGIVSAMCVLIFKKRTRSELDMVVCPVAISIAVVVLKQSRKQTYNPTIR